MIFLWLCGCGLHVMKVDVPKFMNYGARALNNDFLKFVKLYFLLTP